MTLNKKSFEIIVGKGENAGKQHFLLFPPRFLPFQKQISILESHLFCRLQILPIRTGLKFCRFIKFQFSPTEEIQICHLGNN